MRGCGLALLLCVATAAPAEAETRTYVLAIGNNAAPSSDGEVLEPLHYADDDAADFFSFTHDLSRSAILLTVLDGPSQRRFPELVEVARPPTLVELRKAVAALRLEFEADQRDGHDPVLLFFFSGHGTRGGKHPPSLALLDQPLTQEILYNEVLAVLPARYVHVFVDACHAEAVVRPRDVQAQTVEVSDEDVQIYAARSTLARFPHVGAVVATESAAEAHEWDVYQRGVFSHEILSGLRGAADVDGDGRVEYSELAAFLGAANREVIDPRARLSVVVHPPAVNGRAALVDLRQLRGARRLVGRPASMGEIYVEDELGNRLIDVHAEPGHQIAVALPAGRALFVHQRRSEAQLHVSTELVRFESLSFEPSQTNARGALDLALHRGLFAASFGPRYYRGYVDHNAELAPVPIPDEPVADERRAAPPAPATVMRASPPPTAREASARSARRGAWAGYGTSAGLTVAAALLGGFAADAMATFNGTDHERTAADARDRVTTLGGAALGTLGAAVVAAGVGTWMLVRARRLGASDGARAGLMPSGPGGPLSLVW